MLFPQSRGELLDLGSGMPADRLEHINEVVIRIDVVQTASDDQGLDHADVLGANFRPAEIPVLPAHWNDAQGVFQMIGVGGHVWI